MPDGPLHRLPFDALRAARDQDPLAARYELVVAPSATLWLHWRGDRARTATRRALTFADPELGIGGDRQATERSAALQQGLRLGRLPHARRESRALERYLGGVEALVGRGASERALKDRNLRDYDILHFAAHAIADETHPERSAVLLSPGSDAEDGLLQAREIEGLDLDGPHRRALGVSDRIGSRPERRGRPEPGAGVLRSRRAVGDRHALAVRDEDAAALFDSFYRVLGGGASLAEAATQARIEAINAGRPASAWASLVVLGNGAIRPFPEGRRETSRTVPVIAVFSLGLVLLLVTATYLATRRRAT